MGRKKGSKKKGAPGPSKVKEADEDQHRTYYKIKATFKCSNDKCGKPWTSVHAWERDEEIFCEVCDSRAQVDKFLDEMCELDNYDCPSCPGEHWQSIHCEEEREEECLKCGASVKPNGTQKRFGRHFWFVCSNPACKTGWEDCSINPQRTQRCSRCRSRGDVVKTTKVHPRRRRDQEGGDAGGGGGGGQHNWEYCDMCADLKGQGKAQTCIQFRKVQCKVVKLADGVFTERITATS